VDDLAAAPVGTILHCCLLSISQASLYQLSVTLAKFFVSLAVIFGCIFYASPDLHMTVEEKDLNFLRFRF